VLCGNGQQIISSEEVHLFQRLQHVKLRRRRRRRGRTCILMDIPEEEDIGRQSTEATEKTP
jgi:hypothetical protein